jgi:hypothetical protein
VMATDTKAAFTPGPWTINVVIDGRSDFADAKIQPMYVLNRSGVGSPIIPREEAAANCHLMQAAPDLLDAVNGLLGLVQLISHRTDLPADLPSAMQHSHRYMDALALVQRIEGGQ